MFINMSSLTLENSGSIRVYEISKESSIGACNSPNQISGSATVRRTDDGFWLSAVLLSHMKTSCSRCLVEYSQPVDMVIEEELLLEFDPYTRAQAKRPEDWDQYFYVGAEYILDLNEIATQYSTLSMPMKSVCRDDCAGICTQCGINKNESICNCNARWASSQLPALPNLISEAD